MKIHSKQSRSQLYFHHPLLSPQYILSGKHCTAVVHYKICRLGKVSIKKCVTRMFVLFSLRLLGLCLDYVLHGLLSNKKDKIPTTQKFGDRPLHYGICTLQDSPEISSACQGLPGLASTRQRSPALASPPLHFPALSCLRMLESFRECLRMLNSVLRVQQSALHCKKIIRMNKQP